MILKPLVTIVILAILSLFVAAIHSSQDEASTRNRQEFKRFRGEPIRFGKRVPREPIRFGKRVPMFESYFD